MLLKRKNVLSGCWFNFYFFIIYEHDINQPNWQMKKLDCSQNANSFEGIKNWDPRN